MTQQQNYTNRIKPGLELPWWFTTEIPAVNDDFEQRVVCLPQHTRWHSTQIPGVELRLLEFIPGSRPRLTGQIRLSADHSPAVIADNPDLEILVQRGELESSMGVYPAGLYLRLPLSQDHHLQELTIRCTESPTLHNGRVPTVSGPEEAALLYLAAGQILTSDTEQRRISTNDPSRWLPGPADGTDVLPLHGHGTGNVMLIRWNTTTQIKPRLDPMGEEVLVLRGTLYDENGRYPAGSWIRNPVSSWQSWHADKGTVLYYKNGHFAAPGPVE